jgi:L,D-peptidoglycan transpeptidase YkuD (ErfK/YbiS/YcfS/YnhG family)
MSGRLRQAFVRLAVFLLVPVCAQAADSELRRAAEALLAGNISTSARYAHDVLQQEPQSRLAYWLQAQSKKVLAGNPVRISDDDLDLLEEARVRLEVTPENRLPKNLVVMPRSADRRIPLLLADATRSRLYVFVSQQGVPVLVDEFYTTIGLLGFNKLREGDQRTPIGVYRIQYEIKNPRRDGFLGKLAMTLDYPNAYDRHTGRTGNGIWIHGVPENVHVRPPLASDGCLAVSNSDLERIRRYIRYNESQIVVVPRVEWVGQDEWLQTSEQAKTLFEPAVSGRAMGGVFYIEPNWPLVVTTLSGNQVDRRIYYQRFPKGLRQVLAEEVR